MQIQFRVPVNLFPGDRPPKRKKKYCAVFGNPTENEIITKQIAQVQQNTVFFDCILLQRYGGYREENPSHSGIWPTYHIFQINPMFVLGAHRQEELCHIVAKQCTGLCW